MKASINYLPESSFLASVEVDDVGEVALILYNDVGQEWYLLHTTHFGWTKTYTFGPLLPDDDTLRLKSFSFQYSEIEYSESKLVKNLERFIQDPKKMITQVFEIDKETVLDRYRNIKVGETYVC